MNDSCSYAGVGCAQVRNPVISYYSRNPSQIRYAAPGHLRVLRYFMSSGGRQESQAAITYPNFTAEFKSKIQGLVLGDFLLNSKAFTNVRFVFNAFTIAAHSQAENNGVYTIVLPDSWHDLSTLEEIALVAHEVFHVIQRDTTATSVVWKKSLFVPMQQEREAYIFQFGVQYELSKSTFKGSQEYRDMRTLQANSTNTVSNWLRGRFWNYQYIPNNLSANWDVNMRSYGLSTKQIDTLVVAAK